MSPGLDLVQSIFNSVSTDINNHCCHNQCKLVLANHNKRFGCSKEPSHWDSSFEYSKHMFRLRNKKLILITHSYLEAKGLK